ncbi:Mitochondrial import inner membrane translocase subunit tim23 [Mycoemilia scoparia]|uniref:Mitochondrial import inner membrane translocase subunit tim23 n=1 Tax=Mycoemilia scoparia TaxID=417184 RepID=A0A9W8DR66_9FUNG|nr:Mitochondrial import inner membrane translocase subunit tim23 [Mycoemilia scoparia]
MINTENPYTSVGTGVSDFLDKVDLNSNKLYPMTPLGDGIEYLSLDDSLTIGQNGEIAGRSWSDDLCYGTGTLYLTGLTTGGLWGFIEGLKNPNVSKNFNIRLNTLLNSITRRGPFVGNSCGIIGLYYNSINAIITAQRGVKDSYGSIGAAALSGLLFKATAGPRSAIISSAICAGTVGTYHFILKAWEASNEKDTKIGVSEQQDQTSEKAFA